MPLKLTIPEKVEIIRLVGDNVRSFREAAKIFNRRHPDRPPLHHCTVAALNKKFDQTGTIAKPTLKPTKRHPDDDIILGFVNGNPRTSVREIARELNLSKNKIWRCLRRHKLKPFKPKFLHTLQEGDPERRLEYCYWLQGIFLEDRRFIDKILFSDEATFTTNGVVSSQNCRYWAADYPNWVITCKSQYSQKVNVWCGILGTRLIGPFFFRGKFKC